MIFDVFSIASTRRTNFDRNIHRLTKINEIHRFLWYRAPCTQFSAPARASRPLSDIPETHVSFHLDVGWDGLGLAYP